LVRRQKGSRESGSEGEWLVATVEGMKFTVGGHEEIRAERQNAWTGDKSLLFYFRDATSGGVTSLKT